LNKFTAVGSKPARVRVSPERHRRFVFEDGCACIRLRRVIHRAKNARTGGRQPLQIDRGGRQISLDFHISETAPDGARQSVPCLGLAAKAFRAPAMTLIEPKVFCGPALTTAAGAEQSGIMIADDDRLIDSSLR
jgi:hypothetical protein